MKQQYQMKLKSMQKFVPFLSKLLERLKKESGNENKIVQMQIFLDLLICPSASVTIEELDKCEHELSGLYESYESNYPADALTESQAPYKLIQGKELSSQESCAKKAVQDDEHLSQEVPNNEEASASGKVHKHASQDEVSNKKMETSKDQINALVLTESTKHVSSMIEKSSEVLKEDMGSAEQHFEQCEKSTENSPKELKESMNDEENKDLGSCEFFFSKSKDNGQKYVEHKADDESESTVSKNLSDRGRSENNSNTIASGGSDGEERDRSENNSNTIASGDSDGKERERSGKSSNTIATGDSDGEKRGRSENSSSTVASGVSDGEKRDRIENYSNTIASGDSDSEERERRENNSNTISSGDSEDKEKEKSDGEKSDSSENNSNIIASGDSDGEKRDRSENNSNTIASGDSDGEKRDRGENNSNTAASGDSDGKERDRSENNSNTIASGDSDGEKRDRSENNSNAAASGDSDGEKRDRGENSSNIAASGDSDGEKRDRSENNSNTVASGDSDGEKRDRRENNSNTIASGDSDGEKRDRGENNSNTAASGDSDGKERDRSENNSNTIASGDSDGEKKDSSENDSKAAASGDSDGEKRDRGENSSSIAASGDSDGEKRDRSENNSNTVASGDSDGEKRDRSENNSNTIASGDSDDEEKVAALDVDSDSDEAVAAASEYSDDEEIEENVEIVKYPEIESAEMILPDSAEEETNTLNSNEEDISAETEAKTECTEEFNENEDPTAETELITFATGSDSKDDEKTDNSDPLNVEDNSSKSNKLVTSTGAATEDDDDDDDVQVIETRNSPICVDSDDDSDPPIISNASYSITQNPSKKVKNPVSQTAEKLKPTPAPQKRTKSLPTSNSIIDTIDLLDSSDEEVPQYTKPAMISPVKRCLLPKPTRQSKRKRSPSTPATSLRPQNRSVPKPPTQLHISTPQSNFLNAVNLRPANTANPPAFSAQLLNKNIIIPNAFYGNPPEVRSKSKSNKIIHASTKSPDTSSTEVTIQQEKIYRRWLDNFLINFASPLQVVSHSCFVLLQRVLKYKFFQKLKEARTNLNVMAQRQLTNETPASLDIQLMLDLRNALFNNEAQLSEIGIKFCEMASTQSFGKSAPLTTDIKSGRVTSRLRIEEEAPQSATPNKNLNGLPKSTLNPTNGYIKKNKKDDTDEYTPKKPVIISGEGGNSVHGERKRSLRTNRSKRYDNNFSYNEDQNDVEEEEEEEDSFAAIARKIEEKRLEAKQKRERMAKSFENAFIEAFSKQIDDSATKRQKLGAINESTNESTKPFSVSPALLRTGMRYGESSAAANVNIHDDQYNYADSLDEGPREHRIYKVAPTAPYKPPKRQSVRPNKSAPSLSSEVITCSDGSDDNDDYGSSRVDLASVPKNTNRSILMTSKNNDVSSTFCIICRRQVQRIVHHYVNYHRGCEVYNSRLSAIQLTQLRRSNGNIAQMSVYKNGQNQYEATCPFCQKCSRFMLSYWYQHFTMHTGEYAYRCGGCGSRKPTRSLLIAHLKTPCRKGASVCQDFTFEAKSNQIEARVCTLCNYIQLHRSNIVQHLRTQHGLRDILPKHIQSVVLLKIDAKTPSTPTTTTTQTSTARELKELDSISSCSKPATNSNSNLRKFFDSFEDVSTVQFNYDDDDPSDDLSFMICDMLDVQMNTD